MEVLDSLEAEGALQSVQRGNLVLSFNLIGENIKLKTKEGRRNLFGLIDEEDVSFMTMYLSHLS